MMMMMTWLCLLEFLGVPGVAGTRSAEQAAPVAAKAARNLNSDDVHSFSSE
jgi:hypothetical protein